MPDFIPAGDAELLGFAQNYSTLITAGPVPLGLTAPIAVTLAGLVADYQTKLTALENPLNRNPVAFFEKSQAKVDLVKNIRETARQIQGTMTVTDLQRVELRLTVRDTEPTQAEVIIVMPALTVLSVQGRNIRIRVRDASGEVRGRIPTADGAIVYSFVGATPPAGYEGWTSEGPMTKDSVIVAFPESVAVGSKVYFTAQWFNTRGTGPGCTPVASVIGAEGALAA
jgi:hypothetical protein